MKRSFVIAILLAVATAGWILSGQIGDGKRQAGAQKPPVELAKEERVPMVRVRRQTAEPHQSEVVLRGRTEALRMVDVKSETQGRVVKLGVNRGDVVKAGQVLVKLAVESRPADLREAKALLEQRRIEFEAARRLSKKGFRAETQLAGSKAALESASAAVRRAEENLNDMTITAPFDGIVDERKAQLGSVLEMGDPVARIVDLDPILIVAEVSERNIGAIEVGSVGQARLVSGLEVAGSVRFVASMANQNTRTFRVELEVDNPDGAIPDGVSAELRLPLGQIAAHLISPAILTLSDEGVVGVMTVDQDDRARFVPVNIIDNLPGGIWLSGLPNEVTLITVGQEFVTDGEKVEPVDEKTLEQMPVAKTS